MTACRCGCPPELHRNLHPRSFCRQCDDCNRYRPPRERWWQIWRKA